MSECAGCGKQIPPSRGGPPRKWCSHQCRKRQYDRSCIDCGARVSGTDPGTSKGRCLGCANRRSGVERAYGREALLGAIRDWAQKYGEPPASTDWNPWKARQFGDEARAQRGEEGWPSFGTVHNTFGSWNAAIEAAGFKPRPRYGGAGKRERAA